MGDDNQKLNKTLEQINEINKKTGEVAWQGTVKTVEAYGSDAAKKFTKTVGNVKDFVETASDFYKAQQAAEDSRNAVDDQYVYHYRDDDGKNRERKIIMRSKDKNIEQIILVQPPNAYPIIFIPDFMGSNLKNEKNEKIWNAGRRGNLSDAWKDVGADKRKRLLRPDLVMVDDSGEIRQHSTLTEEEMKRRGWGSVSFYLYGPFLAWLEDRMNDFETAETGVRARMAKLESQSKNDTSDDIKDDLSVGNKTEYTLPEAPKFNENDGFFKKLVTNIGYSQEMQGAAMMGGIPVTKNIYSLTEDQFKNSYRYRYPVYAFGYNWMMDNNGAVKALKQFVEKTRTYEKNRLGGDVSKVILVTHGSGGLIARKFAKLNPDLVKGIVFGAMPATGMPETYKRIKMGSQKSWMQSIQQVGVTAGKGVFNNFWVDTLKPALTSEATISESAFAGAVASEGGPLAIGVAAGTTYAKGVVKDTIVQGSINTYKEGATATYELQDNAIIEGKEEEDVAVVAAESLGYLQTLPFIDYPVKEWLNIITPKASKEIDPLEYLAISYTMKVKKLYHMNPLPKANPFLEIYTSSKEMGIYNEASMNPGIPVGDDFYTARYNFIMNLKTLVQDFQKSIAAFYPTNSYVFSGLLSLIGSTANIEGNQSSFSVDKTKHGDGVVPYVSAKPAHDAAKEEAVFAFEHRKAFFDDASRLFVVSSITKMATS